MIRLFAAGIGSLVLGVPLLMTMASAGEETVRTSSCGGSPPGAVLANPRITLPEGARLDVVDDAVDHRLLRALQAAAAKHSFGISVMNRGHFNLESGSNHYWGRAADIATVDGGLTRPGHGATRLLAERLAQLLRDEGVPAASVEVIAPDPVAGLVSTDGDHKDHIHVGIDGPLRPWAVREAGTDPSGSGNRTGVKGYQGELAPVSASRASAANATSLDAYLDERGSPLAGLGAVFVREGTAAEIDPRFLVAIAGAETAFANYGPSQSIRNPFGMGPGIVYPSYEAAIVAAAANLAGPLYLGDGRTTISAIQARWAPEGVSNDPADLNSNWTRNVSRYYAELGGDPTGSVTLTGSCGASGGPPEGAGPEPEAGGDGTRPLGVSGFLFPVQGQATFSNDYAAARPSGGHCPERPGWHCAIDILAARGTPVASPVSGVITVLGVSGLGGKRMWISAGADRFYLAHLERFARVRAGQAVAAGQTVGYVGTSGSATGTPPHLHLAWERGRGANQINLNPFFVLSTSPRISAENKPVSSRTPALERSTQP